MLEVIERELDDAVSFIENWLINRTDRIVSDEHRIRDWQIVRTINSLERIGRDWPEKSDYIDQVVAIAETQLNCGRRDELGSIALKQADTNVADIRQNPN